MALTASEARNHAQQAARGHLRSLETLLKAIADGDVPLNTDENKLASENGSGIDAAAVYRSSVVQIGGIVYTKILIDLTGLNSGATGDIIGDDGAANCHLGQIVTSRNGTIFSGRMRCIEQPATGDADVDVYSATESTGAEDAAVTGLTETALVAAGGALSAGSVYEFTALPAADEYLYLTSGGAGADATYTAGKLLIELEGYVA
jgi:hypothetical protein